MSYRVVAGDEIADDIRNLEDEEVRKEAIRLMLKLREDPHLGAEMRERYNLRVLAGCRRISFDRPGWKGKPRYRLVYRNEPEGAPHDVVILAVGRRQKLMAYRAAAKRLRGRPGAGV